MSELRCDCDVIHPDAVELVRAGMLVQAEYEDIAALFKHFSDPTRMRILHALMTRELCVCDLAVLLNLTKSAVSHQLKALKLGKLVRSRREGQVVFYSLDDEHVGQIMRIGLEHLREK